MLRPGRFNRLLTPAGGLGQTVEWRKAYTCPCRDPHSGSPRQGCGSCGGRGWIWAEAVGAWTGLAGQKIQREWMQSGEAESGDQILTIPSDSPLWAAGEKDRIVMADSSEPFSLPLVRGSPTDRLRFPVVTVDRVFWLDADDATVEGVIPDVGPDGVMTWSDGGPPAGQQYSITGRKRPEFQVLKDMPQDRSHAGGMALPRKVIVRRFDLAGR